MKKNQLFPQIYLRAVFFLFILSACSSADNTSTENKNIPDLHYTLTIPKLSSDIYHVELSCNGWIQDTIDFKMPEWTPGNYQIMDFEKKVGNFSSTDATGKKIMVSRPDNNTWEIILRKNTPFKLSYDVQADRNFVATNYLDSTHAYIVPAATFLYINTHINTPVSIAFTNQQGWNRVATGLDAVQGKTNEFSAPDFDVLFDCPMLIGNLEELPTFEIQGIQHRFIGYNLGSFNRVEFMSNLKKIVQAGVNIIGDIPYKHYTFIAIGPGRGGIEHLNSTTVSFSGDGLDKKETMIKMMNFLAHEYFHLYNVKRIRPFELGPFDYEKENRTNLLWLSEGFTVYYEYLIVKRAGLINEQDLFSDFENSINATENDPGRFYQSLEQASYNTWSDGPFGNMGKDADKSISYYDKGPVVGMILDFTIRNATDNKKSLDDVMRLLYWHYYKKLKRGFTDAEFQQACESVAGISLSPEFEYVYTTKEIDYNHYLNFAGLKVTVETNHPDGKRKFIISRLANMSSLQNSILHSWMGE